MKVQGTLTESDMSKLYTTLDISGFADIEIEMLDGDEYEISPGSIIYRNIENPDESKMCLLIKAKPKFKPFAFGKVLGIKDEEDGEFYFIARGDVLSEKSYYDYQEEGNP